MYNSYLEYVLDNPVNYDFTKTAGILDGLKGLLRGSGGAKALEGAATAPMINFNKPFLPATMHMRSRRYNQEVYDKAIKLLNSKGRLKPTTITRNSDGTRTVAYNNPYTKERLDALQASKGRALTSGELASFARDRDIYNNALDLQSMVMGNGRLVNRSITYGKDPATADFSVLLKR